jgi:hypothetical protein
MKTGDKVRIVKVCWPFVKMNLLGKVSKINILEDGSIYLVDLKRFGSRHLIELVHDDSVDEILENAVVYVPEKISTEIKKYNTVR